MKDVCLSINGKIVHYRAGPAKQTNPVVLSAWWESGDGEGIFPTKDIPHHSPSISPPCPLHGGIPPSGEDPWSNGSIAADSRGSINRWSEAKGPKKASLKLIKYKNRILVLR